MVYNLPDPNTAQAGLISVVVGAGAAWFGLYAGTGKEVAKLLLANEIRRFFKSIS